MQKSCPVTKNGVFKIMVKHLVELLYTIKIVLKVEVIIFKNGGPKGIGSVPD